MKKPIFGQKYRKLSKTLIFGKINVEKSVFFVDKCRFLIKNVEKTIFVQKCRKN